MDLETIKYGLGAIVVVVVLGFAVVYLARFLTWVERSEIARQKAEAAEAARKKAAARSAEAAPPQPEGVPAHHVAAIAAAVAAVGYRVVHIADAATTNAWAAEGRLMHQTSHRPH